MRLKPTSALLAVLLACAPTLARADYAAGLQAYDSGDFTTAYMEWLPLAKQGDAKAQHGLALLYETGRGVPVKDDAEAAKWYAAAALQGVAELQANLALMFAEGRGVKQDYKRAAGLWEQAAGKGVAVASYDLGLLYLNGYGVDKNPAKAAEWFEKAAEMKVVDAQYAIARLYRFGTGVPQDFAKARSWYEQAAAAGHSLAGKELAAMEAEQPGQATAPAQQPPSQQAAVSQPETLAAPPESTTPAPATGDADDDIPTIITEPQTPPRPSPRSRPRPTARRPPPQPRRPPQRRLNSQRRPRARRPLRPRKLPLRRRHSRWSTGSAPATADDGNRAGSAARTACRARGRADRQRGRSGRRRSSDRRADGGSATPTETQVATAPAIHIWLSSQKSREQAERGWQELKTAYPDLLDKLELTVREVDLGAAKGVWYRVYAGPLASKQDAKDLCARIKAQPPNSNCLVATD